MGVYGAGVHPFDMAGRNRADRETLFMPVGYSPWVFLALSAAFLAFHNSHAWIVYQRNY
jgi:hypothetical protein